MERRNFLKATVGTVGVVGLAGCAEQSRSEKIDDMFKAHAWLREGESLGGEENSDEHWQVTVEAVHDDETIDLSARKIVADEVGQNKEGIDPTYTFERKRVAVGDLEVIEDDFRIGYIGYEDGEAHVGFDDYLEQHQIDEVVN